ncbi:aminoacyl-tRNA hydrolase [Brachyspira sp. SAP_772]|uniref:aminoacyl-tRNA hydrolase n=1 Tax=Brachyspira sp. SAP_772 TaxID=2608385 RepID=UPI0012F4C8AD|nr:aminoacyl-tRNA hydrolase [Brachyspira sp. SAP_772]
MMKLVMGLGNPGSKYQNHRHNVGYMILDKVAKKLNVELDIKKKKTVFGKAKYGKIEYLLLKPQTFMNLSGEAALYMASFMKIAVDDIIVIYDDMNIPVGEFKLVVAKNDTDDNDNEEKEGPIKHNGIKSIEESLKSNNFTRVGIGIGTPTEDQEMADFVLSPFTKDERKKIKDITDDVVNAICKILFESNNKTSKKKYL